MKNKFVIFIFICFLLVAVFYANKILRQSVATNRIHHYMDKNGFPVKLIKKKTSITLIQLIVGIYSLS